VKSGVLLVVLVVAVVPLAAAEVSLVPNADFTSGDRSPAGWALSGGQGRWVDRNVLEVTGDGKGSNQWQCDGVSVAPGGLYRFEMRGRQVEGAGCVISGPTFANRDYPRLADTWQWYGHVFRVPDGVRTAAIRVGQWETKGTIQFDAVRLTPVIPVFRPVGRLLLGEGESIRDGRYTFHGVFGHPGSNFHRTLASSTAPFNSDRWCLSGESQVTYRFGLPGFPMTAGEVEFTVNHHTAGACQAEVSRDGHQWRPLARQNGLGTAKARLPAELFPCEALWLRLRPADGKGSFQVNEVRFEAPLSGDPPSGTGRTLYADASTAGFDKAVQSITLDDNPASGQATLQVTVKNPSSEKTTAVLAATLERPNSSGDQFDPLETPIYPGRSHTFELKTAIRHPGTHRIVLDVNVQGVGSLQTAIPFTVPEFYRPDYGEQIEGISGKAAVWWCDATRKVPRNRPLPTQEGPAARLAAARNDYEAVQIVVRPKEALSGLTAVAGPLAGPGGAAIAAQHVRVLRVHYHFVDHPTDGTGVRDWWPDALPPLRRDKPLDVPSGANQPLWVLVYVPKDTPPGDYTGSVALRASGWSATVPLKLHVWNFALPERNHLETAFGLDLGLAFQYHGAKTETDRRKLMDLYFRTFAEHRISPYDPTPLDHFEVKFITDAAKPRVEIDFGRFDRAMAEAIEKYHFTNFSLPIQGMGGGTFHARHDPQIGPFKEDTPQYQALFADQVRQIESHLRAKGWLDMAYVYWFDEPDPKDYAFVRSGMERLKRYAPGIRRMLTEEPTEALFGAVDIWCPVSFNYDHAAAEKRRQHGERFWWYVCCGPKAPYCTLFIDHPATELRVWHWQTWQRKITGTLVWSTNYWTSSAAYPERPQNPYEDPMGYVSGYGTPRGTKAYWGNGDGRFIYPPEAAAVPGLSGDAPVLESPVSSIRWEMLREGVEDYEYLYLLRERLAARRGALSAEEAKRIEQLLEVPSEITRDMTTFTTDPAPIYARRAAIAEAIEKLGP
jgi:hypothetical protein